MVTSFGLAFMAGVLSSLSPCVLPLLPIVLGAAASRHRLGPVALAAGLALSFVTVGLFVAIAGFALGIDAAIFRMFAAGAMVLVGLGLLMPALQQRLATVLGPAVNWGSDTLAKTSAVGWTGQFFVGLLLGAFWSPCPAQRWERPLCSPRRARISVKWPSRCCCLGSARRFPCCWSVCCREKP